MKPINIETLKSYCNRSLQWSGILISLALLLMALTLSGCDSEKRIPTDLELLGFSGHIKSIKLFAEQSEKDMDSVSPLISKNVYNPHGRLIEERNYYERELMNIKRYIYDGTGLLNFTEFRDKQMSLINKYKHESEFNEQGFLVSRSRRPSISDPLKDTLNVIYSKFPDKIFEYFYDSNKRLSKCIIYTGPLNNSTSEISISNGELKQISHKNLFSNDLWSATLFDCVKKDDQKNCIKYKLTEQDSIVTYADIKIEYFKE